MVEANFIKIGKNTIIEKTATIRGINGKADKIIIGDNSYIGHDVQIICDNFELGDYCKIHHHTNIHGYKPCKIGHNAWIGQYCIIDSIGQTTIGHNCGIGAHSQLWSHIKYGDTLEGCKYLSDSPMRIGNHVWFVGHCIISPITAEDHSMALVGSVITKDMKFNNIYAGSPANNITSKIGNPYIFKSNEEKLEIMKNHLLSSGIQTEKIKIVSGVDKFCMQDDISYFDIVSKTYTKKLTENEIDFMKFLLPEKAKFVPYKKGEL